MIVSELEKFITGLRLTPVTVFSVTHKTDCINCNTIDHSGPAAAIILHFELRFCHGYGK